MIRRAAGNGESATEPAWSVEIRRLMVAVSDFQFPAGRSTPLIKLCAPGADYGWRELEKTATPRLLAEVSSKAKRSLKRDLRRNLEKITRPCLELERKSFGLAMRAIGLPAGKPDAKAVEKMFLREKPSHRLVSLFTKFPVLARLWCELIWQWREHVMEVLLRLATDRLAISRAFFRGLPVSAIADARFGLSDRHNSGRTVVRLQFKAGSVIYKPRSGAGESEWFSLLRWMTQQGFRPKLRAARVLSRRSYCWMEYIAPASCRDEPGVRRFFERMGGIIAAAYLLKAVDCHRENVIAAGEDPFLVDVDALWHVSSVTKTQSPADILYRTGFFPNSKRLSLQSRSSVLGGAATGAHLARINGRRVAAADYANEIIRGFSRAWSCTLGTASRRAAFLRRLRHIRSQRRRWIYRATERYASIIGASVQPLSLRSEAERNALIKSHCLRSSASESVIQAEFRALRQLNIPYFIRRTGQAMPPDKGPLPMELPRAVWEALCSVKGL